MTGRQFSWGLLVFFIIFLAASGCATRDSKNPGNLPEGDITGYIKKIEWFQNRPGIVCKLLVKGDKKENTLYSYASITVSIETKIFTEKNRVLENLPYESLKTGRKVHVRFTGPVLEISPVIARGYDIEILDSKEGNIDGW